MSTGNVSVRGHVSYMSQEPWVFSGSLRQNITLGNPFIKEKYDAVLNACALKKVQCGLFYPRTHFIHIIKMTARRAVVASKWYKTPFQGAIRGACNN